jgi:HTH-type transcriptional regulator/antitoxin HigA
MSGHTPWKELRRKLVKPEDEPRIAKIREQMQADLLREQMAHHEKLRDGRITSRKIISLYELPIALIEARIAAKLSQLQLAERIGVTEQQIQLWETDEYSDVDLTRLQDIADALGVQMHGTITFSNAA